MHGVEYSQDFCTRQHEWSHLLQDLFESNSHQFQLLAYILEVRLEVTHSAHFRYLKSVNSGVNISWSRLWHLQLLYFPNQELDLRSVTVLSLIWAGTKLPLLYAINELLVVCTSKSALILLTASSASLLMTISYLFYDTHAFLLLNLK